MRSKFSHTAYVKLYITDIGRKFETVFLEHLSSIMICLIWRCSLDNRNEYAKLYITVDATCCGKTT